MLQDGKNNNIYLLQKKKPCSSSYRIITFSSCHLTLTGQDRVIIDNLDTALTKSFSIGAPSTMNGAVASTAPKKRVGVLISGSGKIDFTSANLSTVCYEYPFPVDICWTLGGL